jgi:hypothetical protein
LAASAVVVIVLPEPDARDVAADAEVAQVPSLYSVTVAASDIVRVNVGVSDEPDVPGDIAVYVIVGAVVSITNAFWLARLLAPTRDGRVRVALLPALSFTVPLFSVRLDVDT